MLYVFSYGPTSLVFPHLPTSILIKLHSRQKTTAIHVLLIRKASKKCYMTPLILAKLYTQSFGSTFRLALLNITESANRNERNFKSCIKRVQSNSIHAFFERYPIKGKDSDCLS